ncbi:NTP transferase domain-containing protein [bacterium]|nr:NTP transferase domain-containing protein [bacterium]
MTSPSLYAVVLAGGSGTRFWPRSRASLPKQFLRLGGTRTLFQATIDRVVGAVSAERILVVTGEAHRSLVREQVPEIQDEHVLLEPAPRDTAAAIGLATHLVSREAGERAVLAVLPSDHVISPAEKLRGALLLAAERAAAGPIVTFGIRPTSPSTAYGYIEKGAPLAPGVSCVRAFCEKPDRKMAEGYLAGGRHAWNSGMFVFSAKTMRDELSRNLPRTSAALEKIAAAWPTGDRARVFASEWAGLEKISIDYAVLEKARAIEVLDVDFEWSDVGSWASAGELFPHDERGNAVDAAAFVGVEASRCVVAGDGRLVCVVGLDDVIVVQSRDAVLVCKKDRAEDVKKLVAELERRGKKEQT